MGCIIKPAGKKEFTDTGVLPKDIKSARKLAKKGKLILVKKRIFDVIVYSTADLVACFEKHIRGIANDAKDYTVMERIDGSGISFNEFKQLFELAINQIPINKNRYFVALPRDYQIRIYKNNRLRQDIPVKDSAELFFKDFLVLNAPSQIPKYSREYHLANQDVLQIIETIEQYKAEHPEEVLSYILIIGHSDIR